MRNLFLAICLFLAAAFTAVHTVPAFAENNGAGEPQGSDAGWSGGGWGG